MRAAHAAARTAPAWCAGRCSCLELVAGPVCRVHDLLLGGLVFVAGLEPAHVYRIDELDAAGFRAALVRVSDGARFSARVELLRSAVSP